MSNFVNLLLQWFEENQRSLPWRNETSPYKIWISEVILQQTRVNQGWNYYLDFINHFPTLTALASASEDEVLKVWQGLGYYSRARHLHQAAQHIVKEHNGVFPNSYTEIRKLKGVGDYTAAAIASIAFQLPYPAVDGNVLRVICRYFGIFEDIMLTSTKNRVKEICQKLMKNHSPGDFNQALMDFGATHCTPANPACETCQFNQKCYAFIHEQTKILPIKIKKIKMKNRYFHFIFFVDKAHQTIIQQRKESDIWKNLYQFPLVETSSVKFSIANYLKTKGIATTSPPVRLKEVQQQLSHQTIFATFYLVPIENIEVVANEGKITTVEELTNFPVPKMIAEIITVYD